MDNPRPEKVAVVEEVRGRLADAEATILTEYRGLTVTEMAQLRQVLSAVGADYKVYKNTLVKLAVAGGRHEALTELLHGPTGIAFVSGEISAVAKALRDFARTNPNLTLKGGVHGDGVLSAAELGVLADLPSRDVLLARMAGAIAAPLQQFAGLLQALPRNLAYGLSALLDQQGGAPTPTAEPEAAPSEPETADATAEATTASAASAEAADTGADEADAATAVADEVQAATADAATAEDPAAETDASPDA